MSLSKYGEAFSQYIEEDNIRNFSQDAIEDAVIFGYTGKAIAISKLEPCDSFDDIKYLFDTKFKNLNELKGIIPIINTSKVVRS